MAQSVPVMQPHSGTKEGSESQWGNMMKRAVPPLSPRGVATEVALLSFSAPLYECRECKKTHGSVLRNKARFEMEEKDNWDADPFADDR